mgnify:CR=1 FL=1
MIGGGGHGDQLSERYIRKILYPGRSTIGKKYGLNIIHFFQLKV